MMNGRPHCDGTKRYDAMDIIKYSLQTYTRINFDKVYLFIKLEDHYDWAEFESYCRGLFPNLAIIKPDRIVKQADWIPVISDISPDKFIWFAQCDDHPFIDFNTDVLYEGLELMRRDPSQFKALATCHWPEGIREAGVFDSQMIGSYLRIIRDQHEPTFIWNYPLLKYMLIDNEWPKEPLWKPGMIDCLPFKPPMYPLYIPLRELVRHFDGYKHVGMRTDSEAEFPELELPPKPFQFTEAHLRWRFRPQIFRGNFWWLPSNIPKEWEDRMIELYKPFIV
jgi:hypothetical protein